MAFTPVQRKGSWLVAAFLVAGIPGVFFAAETEKWFNISVVETMFSVAFSVVAIVIMFC